jgi:hypothetical protein
MNYPLYGKLQDIVEQQSPSYTVNATSIAHSINSIANRCKPDEVQAHYEELAALIYHHFSLQNQGLIREGPIYEHKIMAGGKGLLFTVSNLPIYLLKIIAAYLEHYSTST